VLEPRTDIEMTHTCCIQTTDMSSIALTGTDIDIDTKYVCHLTYK